MKSLITAAILLALSGNCRAFELESLDAASMRASWSGPAIPVSAPARVREYSSGVCRGYPLAMKLAGRTVTLPATGIWTLESHLATGEDSFPGSRAFPRTVRENVYAHLDNSCALLKKLIRGADCGKVYTTRWDKEWTPPEHGKAGQGAVAQKPSKEEELWVFNMMWLGKAMPKPGTKFLATYNGRSVVVVGGYERGPSVRKFLGGFQREVLWYLGAAEDSSRITLSALRNQDLRPGPVDCAGN